MKDEVLGFISRFTAKGKRTEVIDAFRNGCCFWFAKTLRDRFVGCDPTIMYAQIDNHFGTMIDGRVYDITGDVTDEFPWEIFSRVPDQLLIDRIVRDCICFSE